jgi:hypothetical protein
LAVVLLTLAIADHLKHWKFLKETTAEPKLQNYGQNYGKN